MFALKGIQFKWLINDEKQKILLQFMHQSSQGNLAPRAFGSRNSEERMILQPTQVLQRLGRLEEGKSMVPDSTRGIKIHKSASLCSPGCQRRSRAGRANPEIGQHSNETSEFSYKEKAQTPQHQLAFSKLDGSLSLAEKILKKRNHFLTIVSRLPVNRQKLKLKL